VYRIVELQGGFQSGVANNEVVFMILEGPMILLAVALLTVSHPGFAFDGHWKAASWTLGKKKNTGRVEDVEMPMSKQGLRSIDDSVTIR
jgi:hypothetical protein